MMAGIRGKNTRPEVLIRKGLFAQGFRYRLHDRNLPGKPDLVFPKYRAVILVNGCFWHGHSCHLFKWPGSNRKFWKTKISRNQEVDRRSLRALKRHGWRVLTVWECAIKGQMRKRLAEVIGLVVKWLKSGARIGKLEAKSLDS